METRVFRTHPIFYQEFYPQQLSWGRLKAACSGSTGFTGPAERRARGKDVGRPCLPGKKDAPGPRVRRCAGRSPPRLPSSPEASRKPVLSQTTAPSLGELWSRSPNKARALSFYDAVVRNCFALGLSKEKKRRKKEGGEGLGKMNNAIVFGHQDRTASRHYPLKRRNETALFNWGPEDQNR